MSDMLITTATELPRLMACIGSRLMPAALPPDHDHEARDEGNAAHWLAKYIFDGIGDVTPGMKAYNGYIITETMIEHARDYISALDQCGEMEIDTTFHGDRFTVNARADHIGWDGQGTLTIDDFKYGWGIVSPEHNWTLIAYAVGWCIKHACAPHTIRLRIHQPRPYHPDGSLREWVLDYSDLMRYHAEISNRLNNPSDQLTTSAQCEKCHALANCPAARMASMNAIDATGVSFSDALPDDVLAFELETLRYAQATIENRFTALEELLTHKIKQGSVVKGYALKARYANRTWLPGLSPELLGMTTGVNVTKAGFVTPAEAERRGVPKSVVDSLTGRALIGTKLERIDATKEAQKVFGR